MGWSGVACTRDQVRSLPGVEAVFRILMLNSCNFLLLILTLDKTKQTKNTRPPTPFSLHRETLVKQISLREETLSDVA